MIKAIYMLGQKALKTECEEITQNYSNLKPLIKDLFETMKNASGVGLAAPQVGLPINLFVVDGKGLANEDEKLNNFKKVFINPKILKEDGSAWVYEEGCLSIPGIRENVKRQPKVHIQYLDENFVSHDTTLDGLAARIVQHEYDHLKGILFTERINPMRKRLIKNKLNMITKGKVQVDYPVKFYSKK